MKYTEMLAAFISKYIDVNNSKEKELVILFSILAAKEDF